MKNNKYNYHRIVSYLFLIFLMIGLIHIGPIPFLQNVSAAQETERDILEYEPTRYQEMITILPNDIQTIDLYYQGGKELEFIFKLQVQQGLPIDVLFMNDENYTYFIEGSKYKFFIDGSPFYISSI